MFDGLVQMIPHELPVSMQYKLLIELRYLYVSRSEQKLYNKAQLKQHVNTGDLSLTDLKVIEVASRGILYVNSAGHRFMGIMSFTHICLLNISLVIYIKDNILHPGQFEY